MPVPNIPSVMNGETCPGCRTPIWGMRPKKCIMCGYDFDNPREEDTIEARTEAEARVLGIISDGLSVTMDDQRDIEKNATARIKQMATEYLEMQWPEPTGGTTRNYTDAFLKAAKISWPEASFYEVETIVYRDTTSGAWQKRIKGKMDLIQQRVVGFQFDYKLKRNNGQQL